MLWLILCACVDLQSPDSLERNFTGKLHQHLKFWIDKLNLDQLKVVDYRIWLVSDGVFFFFLTFFPQDKITEKTEQDWPSYGNPNSDLKAHI